MEPLFCRKMNTQVSKVLTVSFVQIKNKRDPIFKRQIKSGIWSAIQGGMGKNEKRTLFYFALGLGAVLLVMNWLSKHQITTKTSAWSSWDLSADKKTKTSSYTYRVVTPQTQGTALKNQKEKEQYKENDYQPTRNFVHSYNGASDFQHPLVASTKFVSKKEQLKKKNDKKKKKSLAKQDDKKGSSRRIGFENDDDEDEDDKSSSPRSMALNGYPISAQNNGNPASATNVKKNQEVDINTPEYWEKPIFVDEDKNMLGKLIDSYQYRKVSNGVFYDLVSEMRQDERVQIREFGVLALTATPSARSFYELAIIKNTDPVADLRDAAGQELANYYLEKRLPYVVTAIKPSDLNGTYEALVVLDQATKKYSDLSALNTNPPTAQQTVRASSIEPRFQQALSTIEQNKLTESSDARVKQQATQTVASLQQFLAL